MKYKTVNYILLSLLIGICLAIFYFPKENISIEILEPIKQLPIWVD